MGPHDVPGYCSFTKAIEHLGDRWSLLIVRQLGMVGPVGFNELSRTLPGRISRSVLAERLRRLEALGVVSRASAEYRLTSVGAGLVPVLISLRDWSETWLPEDPAVVEREPAVVLAWLAQRVRTTRLPAEPVVLEFWLHEHGPRYWLVLQADVAPYGCLSDPLLDADRYVYLRCAAATLLALARGRQGWSGALRDGSLTVTGSEALRRRLPDWFAPEVASTRHRGIDPRVPEDRVRSHSGD